MHPYTTASVTFQVISLQGPLPNCDSRCREKSGMAQTWTKVSIFFPPGLALFLLRSWHSRLHCPGMKTCPHIARTGPESSSNVSKSFRDYLRPSPSTEIWPNSAIKMTHRVKQILLFTIAIYTGVQAGSLESHSNPHLATAWNAEALQSNRNGALFADSRPSHPRSSAGIADYRSSSYHCEISVENEIPEASKRTAQDGRKSKRPQTSDQDSSLMLFGTGPAFISDEQTRHTNQNSLNRKSFGVQSVFHPEPPQAQDLDVDSTGQHSHVPYFDPWIPRKRTRYSRTKAESPEPEHKMGLITLTFLEPLKLYMTEANPKAYGWIGSHPGRVGGRDATHLEEITRELFWQVDELLIHGQEQAQHESAGRMKSSAQGISKTRVPAIQHDLIFHVEVVRNLKVFLKKVWALNGQFLSWIAVSSTKPKHLDEQMSLQKWLMKEFLLPLDTWFQVGTSRLEDSPLDSFHTLLVNYLSLNGNPILWTILQNRRDRPENPVVSERDTLVTQLAVIVLGTYYKTKNELKWTSFFENDDMFLRLLAEIRKNLYNRNGIAGTSCRNKVLAGMEFLPWADGLKLLHAQKVKLKKTFIDFFKQSVENISSGILVPQSELHQIVEIDGRKPDS